jgi:hypothetical protein
MALARAEGSYQKREFKLLSELFAPRVLKTVFSSVAPQAPR